LPRLLVVFADAVKDAGVSAFGHAPVETEFEIAIALARNEIDAWTVGARPDRVAFGRPAFYREVRRAVGAPSFAGKCFVHSRPSSERSRQRCTSIPLVGASAVPR